jgi:hypothetical protein
MHFGHFILGEAHNDISLFAMANLPDTIKCINFIKGSIFIKKASHAK